MEKIIVICGATGTGKTKLAIKLAKVINGEIISADSRQVYIGLTIGTGKEYSLDPQIPIWGYDLVDPKQEISVAYFEKFALEKIEDIIKRGKTPILVGGTGLYIKAVVDGIPTSIVPQDEKLRGSLINKTSDELFELLLKENPAHASKLNSSDKHNPRRLIRALEISRANILPKERKLRFNPLLVGLTASQEELYKRIEVSVKKRVEMGVIEEIKELLHEGVEWSHQSMTSLGYNQWKEYFENNISVQEAIKDWINKEQQYVKRQRTWFKKDNRIHWFDITAVNYVENVIQLCQHFLNDAKKN